MDLVKTPDPCRSHPSAVCNQLPMAWERRFQPLGSALQRTRLGRSAGCHCSLVRGPPPRREKRVHPTLAAAFIAHQILNTCRILASAPHSFRSVLSVKSVVKHSLHRSGSLISHLWTTFAASIKAWRILIYSDRRTRDCRPSTGSSSRTARAVASLVVISVSGRTIGFTLSTYRFVMLSNPAQKRS